MEAALVAEHRLLGTRASAVGAHGLGNCVSRAQSTSSVVVVHRLSCCEASGIFPDQRLGIFLGQGSNLLSPALAGGFLTPELPRKP